MQQSAGVGRKARNKAVSGNKIRHRVRVQPWPRGYGKMPCCWCHANLNLGAIAILAKADSIAQDALNR
jgi:hypothetical protein